MDRKKYYILYYVAGALFILAGILSMVRTADYVKLIFGAAMGLFWIIMGISVKKKNNPPTG